MSTVTIRILDEVNCTIVGLDPKDLEELHKRYSLFVPGYIFAPKFKLGVWNGKIAFIKESGKTFVLLLDEIIPKIKKLGYSISIDDRRQAAVVFPDPIDNTYLSHIMNPKNGEPIVLQAHQVEMINTLLAEGSGMAISATGSGKTYSCAVMADIYGHYGLKCLVIVPDKSLVRQTRNSFITCGVDTGIYYGDEKDTAHMHVISTWQSLQNAVALIQDFQVVIVDEAHQTKATVLSKLLNEYGTHIAHRFGMTGTLPKEKTDQMTIKTAIGPVKFEYHASEAIASGWSSDLCIRIIQIVADMRALYEQFITTQNPVPRPTYTQFKRAYLPDYQAEKTYLQNDKKRLKYIANDLIAKSQEEKGNVLCLVNGVSVGKKLAALIPDAYFVHGADDVAEREKVYQLFQTEDHVIAIATLHIAAVGLDIPRIFHFCIVDFGKSFVKTIQAIGRGLRKAHDKDFVYVTDYCSDTKYGNKHMRERIAYYEEAHYPYSVSKCDLNDLLLDD